MIRRSLIAAALCAVALAAPALAAPAPAADCRRPAEPVIPDPQTASETDITNAREAVVSYIAASDAYQDCLLQEIRRIEQTGAVDWRRRNLFFAAIQQNQTDKEAVGARFNAVADAFNARRSAVFP